MMIISWFFWPSPAVALIGAVLIPVAQKVGLPKLSAAMAMNLFGHGIALSSDIILQGASRLTSNSAGITISELNSTLIPLQFHNKCRIIISIFCFWNKHKICEPTSCRKFPDRFKIILHCTQIS